MGFNKKNYNKNVNNWEGPKNIVINSINYV